jgi:hypothetical protein
MASQGRNATWPRGWTERIVTQEPKDVDTGKESGQKINVDQHQHKQTDLLFPRAARRRCSTSPLPCSGAPMHEAAMDLAMGTAGDGKAKVSSGFSLSLSSFWDGELWFRDEWSRQGQVDNPCVGMRSGRSSATAAATDDKRERRRVPSM